jgi:hypothetical protein
MIFKFVLLFCSIGAVVFFISRHQAWLPGLSYLIFFVTWVLISTIFLDAGVYISEQQRMSDNNYSFYLLLLYQAFFFGGIVLSIQAIGSAMPRVRRNPRGIAFGSMTISSSGVERGLFRLILLAVVLLIIHTLVSGSPMLGHTSASKATFWESAAMVPQLRLLNNQLLPLIFAFSVVYDSRRRSMILAFLMLVNFALLGHKFSVLLLVVYLAAYPSLQYVSLAWAFSWKAVLAGSSFLAASAVLVYLTYARKSWIGGAPADVIDFVVQRIFVLQGHAWWGVVEYVDRFGSMGLNRLFSGETMDLVMRVIAPNVTYRNFSETGSTFTAAYPAILYLTVGWWALVIQFFVGVLFAFIIYLLHHAVRLGFLGAFLGLKLFLASLFFVLMGRSSDLFNVKNAAWFFILCMLLLMTASVSRRSSSRGVESAMSRLSDSRHA